MVNNTYTKIVVEIMQHVEEEQDMEEEVGMNGMTIENPTFMTIVPMQIVHLQIAVQTVVVVVNLNLIQMDVATQMLV
ncbi:hypothetical protein AMV191 [Betaentomopoxvirus amoorei]|uniref:AMV191 n=1 Tax=Amsacta moorei entomopoxvirus TaxID=28321 RepID=Q9EML4_AMEPV|nr:hypothetical protein AMV191 [Amsacta moorei entomopoxvirus]AAG02897.1 AMV191 [Amsacta moorei entomopoxvirus]